jgi:L-ascorbate metabolism protein UlaG (beta-lactamase superfamily)
MYNGISMIFNLILRVALAGVVAGATAVAAPETFATSAGTLSLTPIQHASLMIQAGGKILYVDPALGSYDRLPKADYILITDIHDDHLAPPIVDKLKKAGTVVVGPKAVAAELTGTKVVSNGEKTTLGPFAVEAIPMYNLTRGPSPGELYHNKGRGNGYIVTFGGKRFYFSGDTEAIPEMKALKNIDVAFVCMNLPYTMTPKEAAEAVRAFRPSIVYPYHYMGSDTKEFAKALEGTGIDVRLREWY